MKKQEITRRTFLHTGSLATLGGALIKRSPLVDEIRAPYPYRRPQPDEPKIRCGVIGYGEWGREIAATLLRTERAEVAAICDHFDIMLRRAEREVPEASRHADYRSVLDDPDIPAVLIATPTHQHRQLVVDAFAAGKHVYCEAPLASTVEDARSIASVARNSPKQIFQSGLLFRSHPQYRSVFGFIRSGALGRATMVRSQWHRKTSWRRASASPDREVELNWRLDPATSSGLVGEIGVQQLDAATWFLNASPVGATGFGSVALWDDGRQVPDTVQAVLEYPGAVRMVFDATLTSSFDNMVDLFVGGDSTIMFRDQNAWMFKEVDAPLLGWEVYARKDRFYKETGVALVADATKLAAQGVDPTTVDPYPETPLFYALEDFLDNNVFGPYEPAASWRVGLAATVVAIRTNQAIVSGSPVTIDPAELELG